MTTRSSLRRRLIASTALIGVFGTGSAVQGQVLPVGPTVISGTPVGYTADAGNLLGVIDLGTSQNTVYNWQSFSVGAASQLDFNYAGATNGAVLNRVTGPTASAIDGIVNAPSNLAVYLVNANGITFGSGANVNVGALIASTLDISSTDFQAGTFHFAGNSTKGVGVAGGARLNATGGANGLGQLVLIGIDIAAAAGSELTTKGAANAVSGEVALIAGTDVTMTVAANSPLAFTIDRSAVAASITADGTIAGRNVTLAFATKNSMTDALLGTGGTITATTAQASDRGVLLVAGTSSDARVVITDSTNMAGDVDSVARIAFTGTVSATGTTGDVIVSSSGGIALASASAARNLALTAAAGDIRLGQGNATTGSATLSASGAVTGNLLAAAIDDGRPDTGYGRTGLTAGTNIVVGGGGLVQLGGLGAGGYAGVLAGGVAEVAGNVTAGGYYRVQGTSVMLGLAGATPIQTAAGEVTITSTSGGIEGRSGLTLIANGDDDTVAPDSLLLDAAGALLAGTMLDGQPLAIDFSGASLQGGLTILAADAHNRSGFVDIRLGSATAVRLGSVAARSLNVRADVGDFAPTAIALGDISVRDALTLTATLGGITTGTIAVTGPGQGLSLEAGSATADVVTGGIIVQGDLTLVAGRDVKLSAAADTRSNGSALVQAGRDTSGKLLQAYGAATEIASGTAGILEVIGGTASVGGDGGGQIPLPPGAPDVTITAGSIVKNNVTAVGSLTMTATVDSIRLGSGTAGSFALLTAHNAVTGLAGAAPAGAADTAYGAASLGAGTGIDVRTGFNNASALGVAQLGLVTAGTTLAVSANGGGLYLGDGTSGTTATLTKTGVAGELVAAKLTSGSTLADGDATILSSTSVRLGTVLANNGALSVTASAGGVTGLATGALALDGPAPTFGRATLTATGTTGNITVTATDATTPANALIQLATATASQALSITANGGGLDLTTGVAGTTATLTKTGIADELVAGSLTSGTLPAGGDAMVLSSTNARLGMVLANNGAVSVTASAGGVTGLATGALALDGPAPTFGRATLTATGTTGTAGNITVTANNAATPANALIQLATATASQALSVTANGGGLDLTTGVAGTTATLTKTGIDDEIVAGSLTSGTLPAGGDATVLSATNARLGTVLANNGAVSVTASAGGVTGLATGVLALDGPAPTFGRATLTATGATGNITVTANNATTPANALVQLASATASQALSVTANGGGLDLTTGVAGTNATLTKTGIDDELVAGSLTSGTLPAGGNATVLSSTNARLGTVLANNGAVSVTASAGGVTGLATAPLALDGPAPTFGRATLTATGTTGNVTVTATDATTPANALIQLATATASQALSVTANGGGLDLTTGIAGTTATLTKTGVADELVAGSLTAGTLANGAQTVAGDVVLASATSIRAGTATSLTGSVSLAAADGAVTGLELGAPATYGFATLTADGYLPAARLGDVTVTASATGAAQGLVRIASINALAADVLLGNRRDVTVTGSGKVEIAGTVGAGRDYKASGASVDLGTLDTPVTQAANGTVVITSTAGSILGHGLTLVANRDDSGGEDLTLAATLAAPAAYAIDFAGATLRGGATAAPPAPATVAGNGNRSSNIGIVLGADGAVRLGTVSARGLYTGGTGTTTAVALGDVSLRNALALDAAAGGITADSITITGLGQGLALRATGGIATTGKLSAQGSVLLDAGGDIALGNTVISNGGNITLTAGGNASGPLLQGLGTITETAGGTDGIADTHSGVAGTDAFDLDTVAVLTGSGPTPGIGKPPLTVPTPIPGAPDVTITAGSIVKTNVSAGRALSMTATRGQLALGTGSAGTTATLLKQSNGQGVDATEMSVGTLASGGLTNGAQTVAGNATLVSSTNARLGSVTSATGSVLVTATLGDVTGASATGGAVLTAAGNTTPPLAGTLTVNAGRTIRLATATARDDITLTAGTLPVATGTLVNALAIVDAGTIVSTTGNITGNGAGARIGTATAAKALTLTGRNGDIVITTSGTAGPAPAAGKAMTLTTTGGTGNIVARTLVANGTIGIAAVNSASLESVTANTGDIGIVATTGSVAGLAGLLGSGGANLNAVNGIVEINAKTFAQLGIVEARTSAKIVSGTITGISTRLNAPLVAITAMDANIAGTILATTSATLTSSSAARLRLGATGNAADFVLDEGEVNRITTPALTFDNGAKPVEIGKLALNATVGSTRLDVLTSDRLDVTGRITAGDNAAASPRTLRLGGTAAATGLASVIAVVATPAQGGRILLTGNTTLELRGANIGVGQTDGFLTSLGLSAGGTPIAAATAASDYIARSNSSLYTARTAGGLAYSDTAVISARVLLVTYGNFALFQNTGSATSGALNAGVAVGNLVAPARLNFGVTGANSGSGGNNGIALFGTVSGLVDSAAALLGPTTITLGGVNPNNARINGCLIGSSGGGCLISAVNSPQISVFDQSQLNIFRTVEDLAIAFDPVVGTNNESLFSDLGSIDYQLDDTGCDPSEDAACKDGAIKP